MNLQLTRTSDYAIRAVVHLAAQPEVALTSRSQIASAQGIPEAYLHKLLPALVRAGLLATRRGPHGGFRLARPAREVSLLAVIEAVDGPLALNVCVSGGAGCERAEHCPVHPVWRVAHRQLVALLAETTIGQLAQPGNQLGDG